MFRWWTTRLTPALKHTTPDDLDGSMSIECQCQCQYQVWPKFQSNNLGHSGSGGWARHLFCNSGEVEGRFGPGGGVQRGGRVRGGGVRREGGLGEGAVPGRGSGPGGGRLGLERPARGGKALGGPALAVQVESPKICFLSRPKISVFMSSFEVLVEFPQESPNVYFRKATALQEHHQNTTRKLERNK